MRERGLGGYFASAPRVRFEADFLAPLFFGQEATATVSLAAIGTSSMTWEFEVWGEEFEGRARTRAARGRYVTVHMGTGQVAATAACSVDVVKVSVRLSRASEAVCTFTPPIQ